MKILHIIFLFLFTITVYGQSLPDNEARKAILDLRADVKLTKDELKKSFERIESQKLASDLELKKANDLIVRLDLLMQQLKNDSLSTSERLQKEINKINILRKQDLDQQNQAVLQLKNENELLKQQIAEMRGDREQLSREISVVQRNQKDLTTGIEDRIFKIDKRLSKIEPIMLEVDGLEFQSDLAEKKDYELAISVFKRGEYSGAVNAFTVFLRKYPNSGFRQSALYWLASAKFLKGDYVDTTNQLRAFLNMNEAHSLYPEAMLMLANAQIELKLIPDAKKTLENLIRDYPRSEAAKVAVERLLKL